MEFYGVSVEAEDLSEKPGTKEEIAGFASWSEISVPHDRKSIDLMVKAARQEGIHSFAIFESRPREEKEFLLSVPIRRTKDGPMTRQRGVDNVDIILLDPMSRHFRDIQVGVVVRGGRFYLTAQKIWAGWITGSSAEDLRFVPSAPEHAYPGADYASIWRGMGEVMRFTGALLNEYGEGPIDIAAPSWNPAASSTPEQGWKTGTVLYFNMITGTGSILDGEEKRFVHFSTIWADGRMKVLKPMSGVLFQLDLANKVIACKSAA